MLARKLRVPLLIHKVKSILRVSFQRMKLQHLFERMESEPTEVAGRVVNRKRRNKSKSRSFLECSALEQFKRQMHCFK